MKALTKYILVALAAVYYLGCAKKNFATNEAKVAESCNSTLGCTHGDGIDTYNYTTTVGGGQVDILFIDDNSGSMSFEQKHMAERFSNFLDALDAKAVDYRIGITTTDISNGNASPRPQLQDGKLISFGNGNYFLTPSLGSSAERKAWFASAIQRSETSQCETFIKNSPGALEGSSSYLNACPSGDERGIYAANLFVQKNPQSMIRPQAHLAMVILSDEDVRSSNYYKSNNMVLADLDLPSSLIKTVKGTYPDKTLSFHSIIVKPGSLHSSIEDVNAAFQDLTYDPVNAYYLPGDYFSSGDSSCLNEQSNQIPGSNFSGSYGYLYSVLSSMTSGIIGNICANDYGSQLSTIGSNISERIQEIGLRCDAPSQMFVAINPNIAGLTHQLEGSVLKFSQLLPQGTQLTLSYQCPSVY